MNKLVFVTLLWAFSFSLIGEFLAGRVDSYFAAFSRVVLALLVFLPFMKFEAKNAAIYAKITLIGAIQIGAMYIFYYNSFLYLSVPEVALFTIFTPFYVSVVYDLFAKRLRPLYLLSVAVAVLGAFIIKYGGVNSNFWLGFLMVQGANLCFGVGQSAYKFLLEDKGFNEQKGLFGWFFVGACLVTGFAFGMFGNFEKISLDMTQSLVLLWLGIGASGLGYFMWNKGACEVDSGTLAIMNNALIPAAIIVNLVFWHKDADIVRLIIGGAVIYISLLVHNKIITYYERKSVA
ncbi:EamA family transporter [Campylobacter sp. MOP7]|uniref:EamA family transporter n=1 Tax=Campylobacter canis TaxID=3378588 RepID=UPI00387EE5C6